MPTYTYRCENCAYQFDLVQRFDDPDPKTCPNCGHVNELVRVYKPVGVVFKGSGFYATDNKSSSGISANGSKPAAPAAGGETAAGGSDTAAAPQETKKTETSGSASKSD